MSNNKTGLQIVKERANELSKIVNGPTVSYDSGYRRACIDLVDKINEVEKELSYRPAPYSVEGYLEGKVTWGVGRYDLVVRQLDALAALQSLAADKDEEIAVLNANGKESYKKMLELQTEVERLKEERRWIPVEERLPIENREGKRYSKRCFFTDGKNTHKGFFFPKKFKLCEWQDFDVEPDEYENYNVEEIDGELWLCEGWWNEYEHNDELYENYAHKVTHWMPLPEPPKTKINELAIK